MNVRIVEVEAGSGGLLRDHAGVAADFLLDARHEPIHVLAPRTQRAVLDLEPPRRGVREAETPVRALLETPHRQPR